MSEETLVCRLLKRAEIRRAITTRKSVQEGKPDRIADLLEEAATTLKQYEEGYKGSCYCCEIVGQKNIELETKLSASVAAFKAQAIAASRDFYGLDFHELTHEVTKAIQDIPADDTALTEMLEEAWYAGYRKASTAGPEGE